jgi:ferredoxin
MNKQKLFKVDDNLCIACGACAKDCLMGIIEMNPKPVMPAEKEASCMECQHCLAVCPKGALSILGKDPADSVPNTKDKPTPVSDEESGDKTAALRANTRRNL